MAYTESNIVLKTKLGHSNFTILLKKRGCKVAVYRNNMLYCHGQWFPDTHKLYFANFIIKEFETILIKSLLSVKSSELIFPDFE